MSLSSIRFLHAADLFLGRPICRLGVPEQVVDSDSAELIDDAPRMAFDRMIDEAIERKVDFVLLGGNTFVEAERSLSARIDLLNGLDRLAENEIRVFVAPGKYDPPEAWREIFDLPDNVTIFFDRESEPVAVLRDGKVIATVACSTRIPTLPANETRPELILRSEAARRPPFTVLFLPQVGEAVISVTEESSEKNTAENSISGHSAAPLVDARADYIALCSGSSRRTMTLKSGIAHHPGPTQGASARQIGPAGCTLIEVDPDGTTQCEFLPTAAVVWEQQQLEISPAMNETDLTERMLSVIGRFTDLPYETVRILQWNVQGHGPVWDMLSDEEARRRFVERFLERNPADAADPIFHHFRMLIDAPTARLLGGEDSLVRDFLDVVEQDARYPHEVLGRCLDEAALGGAEWIGELRALIPHLDHERIFAEARRLGVSWFSPVKGGSHSK